METTKRAAPARTGQTLKKLKRLWPVYLMMLPGIAYLVINNYIPMAGIVVAFKNYKHSTGIWGSDWVGFKNFEFLFKTNDAFTITRNTILYNLCFIVLGTLCALALAIILNGITSLRLKKTYQTIVLLPYLLSIIVISFLVYAFLAPDVGFINNAIIKPGGGTAVSWYTEAGYWPLLLVFVHLWKNMGYQCIVYMATLSGIDPSYYEAAMIDGAGKLKQIFKIQLPLMRGTIITMTLLAVGRIFYSDFGLFYQVPMNSGALYDVTSTIDTYVYRGLLQNPNIAMSSAAGVYQSIVGFVLVITANLIVRRLDKDSALF